jgi:hypothetical protein
MTTEDPDDLLIGLTKLELKPGDILVVSAPPGWCEAELRRFENYFMTHAQRFLRGVQVLMVSEEMKVFVRRSDPPPDDSRLADDALRMTPALGEA